MPLSNPGNAEHPILVPLSCGTSTHERKIPQSLSEESRGTGLTLARAKVRNGPKCWLLIDELEALRTIPPRTPFLRQFEVISWRGNQVHAAQPAAARISLRLGTTSQELDVREETGLCMTQKKNLYSSNWVGPMGIEARCL